MNINHSKIQNNILLFLAKKNKLQVNISDISAILGIRYLAVKHEIINSEHFPKPIVDDEIPLLKKWLLYDILVWVFNKE
ncbi:hypothetical protein GA0061081_102217 [Gilliamella bombicola]|uniref:Transcriptional regulator, AlpA family n=1 Tax=Gilliamella bombicola TaxID=1798182 RepID=A0A1C4A3A0_9GAMM|nr:hypothetical protein [Gilliamella bombicola]SCB88996.1 hypothetical protein GA0061081_102217 [Gilliamella bombicola]